MSYCPSRGRRPTLWTTALNLSVVQSVHLRCAWSACIHTTTRSEARQNPVNPPAQMEPQKMGQLATKERSRRRVSEHVRSTAAPPKYIICMRVCVYICMYHL